LARDCSEPLYETIAFVLAFEYNKTSINAQGTAAKYVLRGKGDEDTDSSRFF
jgi:hypothetical protein